MLKYALGNGQNVLRGGSSSHRGLRQRHAELVVQHRKDAIVVFHNVVEQNRIVEARLGTDNRDDSANNVLDVGADIVDA